MQYKEWAKLVWEEIMHKTLRVVAFPVPPFPVQGMLFQPDSFMSRTFDKDTGLDRAAGRAAIMPTHLGPAILMYPQVKDLLSIDLQTGLLQVNHSGFCATVSFRLWDNLSTGDPRTGRVDFARDVSVDSVRLIAKSCNDGSHVAIPQAPYMTALLQYAAAPVVEQASPVDLAYMAPEDAAELFLYSRWEENAPIDLIISQFCVHREVSYYKVKGPGIWALEYLRRLRANTISMESHNGELERIDYTSQEDGWQSWRVANSWRID